MKSDDDIQQWLDERRVRLPDGPGPTLIGLDHAVAVIEAAAARISEGDPGFARGWLLHGRPGTGKSALTGVALRRLPAEVPAYDLAVPWLTPERLSRSLAHLADKPLSVVLWPELDAWAGERWASDPESRKMLFAALEGLDTLGRDRDPRRGVVVIATTSRRSAVDSALLRPGRIDVQITCPLPGRRHRLELVDAFLADWPTDGLDLEQLADQTTGWSPAQLQGAVGEAIGRALARSGRGTPITQPDLIEAIRGHGHRERELEPELAADRLRVAAVHEAGHVAASLRLGLPVRAVELKTSGDGSTQAGREDALQSEHEVRAGIVVAFAGTAAERTVLGAAGTGGTDDVAQATRLAISLVEAGLDDAFPPISRMAFAERNPRTIDEPLGDHVMEVLAQARERAQTLVALQRDAIERLATRLMETPVLAGDALQQAIREAGFSASTASGEETDPWTFARSWAAGPNPATSRSSSPMTSAAATTTTPSPV